MESNLYLIFPILIYIVITIIVFFIFRELFCWYWKINKRIELQEEQLKFQEQSVQLLKEILKFQKHAVTANLPEQKNTIIPQSSNQIVKNQNNISYEEWQKKNVGKTLNEYLIAMKNKD